MCNAVEIIPNLWLGNIHSATSADFMETHKISCIINCTKNREFGDLQGQVIKKIRIPIKDNGKDEEINKLYGVLDTSADLLYKLLPHHRILIHCYAGRQRSVSIVLAFLMKYGKFNLQEAIDVLQSKKTDIGINFSKALVRYQLDLWNNTTITSGGC